MTLLPADQALDIMAKGNKAERGKLGRNFHHIKEDANVGGQPTDDSGIEAKPEASGAPKDTSAGIPLNAICNLEPGAILSMSWRGWCRSVDDAKVLADSLCQRPEGKLPPPRLNERSLVVCVEAKVVGQDAQKASLDDFIEFLHWLADSDCFDSVHRSQISIYVFTEKRMWFLSLPSWLLAGAALVNADIVMDADVFSSAESAGGDVST